MLATKTRPARAKRRMKFDNMQELLDSLGGIPASRILYAPAPGTATVKDVIRHVDGDDRRLVELVNGTLVEKVMGAEESFVALELSYLMKLWNAGAGDTGMFLGADGTLRIMPLLVRIPDISFVAWDRLPNRKVPQSSVPALAPDLAVEVISKGNTKAEMTRKIGEYFQAGVQLVWLVFPKSRTIRVYTSAKDVIILTEAEIFTGGDVLPGFELPLAKLFEKLPREPKKKATKPKKKQK